MRFSDPARFAASVLDALTANIAVVDREGVIVAVNEAWLRFARENAARDPKAYVGTSYLDACRPALAAGSDPALPTIADGLRAILDGAANELVAEYSCPSPEEERWFRLQATPLPAESGCAMVVAHEDVTARRRVEQTLRETQRRLTSVLDSLPVGVWIMDRTGRIVHGNPAGQQIWAGARYVGLEQFGEYKGWWADTGQPIAADEWAAARAIRRGETSIDEEIEIECFDGTRKVILNSAIPLFDDSLKPEGSIIVNQDITARKRDEAELRRAKNEVEAASRELTAALERERMLSRVDALTGAINRRYFFDLAEHEVASAFRYHHPLALILFDVDEFKAANDTLGHQGGDELLERIGRVCREHLRDADIFARYGGDEFVILLPHTGAAEAAVVAERMREALAAQSVVTESGAFAMTISSGIAELAPPDDSLAALVQRADVAMYEAKNKGRNRTIVFSRPGAGA